VSKHRRRTQYCTVPVPGILASRSTYIQYVYTVGNFEVYSMKVQYIKGFYHCDILYRYSAPVFSNEDRK
jgi:hypothetical protein